ncbi:MAG TPA: isocitrate dehydrogenase (NADP(+)) [Thermoplasmata archaeon]|nr:isocitrate dehydrogenase (NADP(+)) [Thermoplasmata archaeon]
MTLRPPAQGHRIEVQGARLAVPDDPIIPLIRGDGIGPDVTGAATRVLLAAVKKAYGGKRTLHFWEVPAGEASQKEHNELLPQATVDAIRDHVVALKGPLTTPIGGGFRSLNVTLRQTLDLYANVRPIFYMPGVPSPMKHPERMNMVLFREATEDVYAGIEWPKGSEEAAKVIRFLREEMNVKVRDDAGIGIKPISEFGTKRLVRKAVRYAIDHHRRSVTLVHKGNIMKYTEGAFRDWGYEVASDEFGAETVTEKDVDQNYGGVPPKDRVVIKDRIADNMLQQLLTRTDEYEVLALPNLNGDYLSDAAAGQVGGLGVASGGNLGDFIALFEPVHGTAPKYAGQDKVNPTAEILAGQMMLDYLGWKEAAQLVLDGVKKAIAAKVVTYDLARQTEGAKEVKCSEFATTVIERL